MTKRSRAIAIGIAIGLGVASAFAAAYVWTKPSRDAMRSLVALMNAANRGALDDAKGLCTARYLAAHPLTEAPEGGLAGLPRTIHKNFRIWRSGPNIWICPTNRQGPVYQFVPEGAVWRFDGLIGLLRNGQVLRTDGDAEFP